ncbi:hypothetical protein HID58_090783 [Brassica napus]|uniref:Uncharacterized protein n=1 Tax=Brassica napus TaxID=3708 RepID=A0ABQ7XBM1_BRANA|nr:hypothetical protein HID58_090783 [Brassica napus]
MVLKCRSDCCKGREIEYDFLELNSPVPLYNCDQQGCFDSVARIGSLVLTVTQEAFWKLGKRLLSSLNDLMGIPVIQNSYSPLMELAKQYEEEQESASATKKLHQKRQFITI